MIRVINIFLNIFPLLRKYFKENINPIVNTIPHVIGCRKFSIHQSLQFQSLLSNLLFTAVMNPASVIIVTTPGNFLSRSLPPT